jgi:aryl-alcohol dehydrogenase-like predicted oxidoreductase
VRKIGRDGPQVGPIGLGAMGLSGFYTDATNDDPRAVVEHAIDRGVTLIDTADMYGPFTNEQLIGSVITGRRDDVVVATKCGLVMRGEAAFDQVNDATPKHVREACDASLLRLGVDKIDLYYLHRVDPAVPIEETIGAMGDLVAAGKVAAIGVCECDVPTLERAQSVHPLAAVQSEMSLWSREPLAEVVPWCDAHDVSFVPYAPLGRGLLAGGLRSIDDLPSDDVRRLLPRFQPDALPANLAIVDRVREIAEASDSTPAQVAIAWLLAQSERVIPIAGMRRLQEVDENLAAAATELSSEQLAALDDLSPAAGDRTALQAADAQR